MYQLSCSGFSFLLLPLTDEGFRLIWAKQLYSQALEGIKDPYIVCSVHSSFYSSLYTPTNVYLEGFVVTNAMAKPDAIFRLA